MQCPWMCWFFCQYLTICLLRLGKATRLMKQLAGFKLSLNAHIGRMVIANSTLSYVTCERRDKY